MFSTFQVGLTLTLTLLLIGGEGVSLRRRERTASATLCPSHPYPVANASLLLSKLQPFLDEASRSMSRALSGSPGGAVVNLVYKDTILWTQGFGLINMSEPERGAPTGNTGFRIGSITKVFTALMALMLRDAGLLKSLDDNVTTYLPEFSIQNPFQTQRGVTFRQLSSHMSGLPRNAPCPGIFDTGCSLPYNKIYENLSKMKLMFPPGFQPEYSNLGFGLLGRALEEAQGSSWEEQVVKMVFDPLAMNNSGNFFTPETVRNLAVGYYSNGAKADLIDIGWDAPAGQMYSSTHDIAQLLKLIFRPEDPYNFQKGQILDGETIREWMLPAYTYPDGTGFGHPWELRPVGNYTLLTKDGVMNGYNAEMQFSHEIKTAFVFLHSCDGCPSHEKVISLAQGILLQTSAILQSMQPGPSLPANPKDYVGTYRAGEAKMMVQLITLFSHTSLVLTEGTNNVILDWREEDTFQLSLHGGPEVCYYLGRGQIGEWVYFTRNGSTVASFTIPGLAYGEEYVRQ